MFTGMQKLRTQKIQKLLEEVSEMKHSRKEDSIARKMLENNCDNVSVQVVLESMTPRAHPLT